MDPIADYADDETDGRVLGTTLTDNGIYQELEACRMTINHWNRIYLRADINFEELQFSASPDGKIWQKIGGILDMNKLSDDYGQNLHFTGTFVGLCAQDLNGTRIIADFAYFEMK